MAPFKRGGIWWYKFYFAGQEIRESSKSSSQPVAKDAERQRRRELEAGFLNIKEVRQQRIRSLEGIIEEYLEDYRLRFRSATFAEHALGHVSRLLGKQLVSTSTKLRYWLISPIACGKRPLPSRSTKKYGSRATLKVRHTPNECATWTIPNVRIYLADH